jgi:hypothetical protein
MTMTTAATPHVSPSDHLAHERHLAQCLRALRARGWEQRLQPLATHMAAQHLVRGRGHAGAPLRHLDVQVLREALSSLLREEWEEGYLIFQLVVEGVDPAHAATERGVSRPALIEMLRDAVDELAMEYEDVAYASVGESNQDRVRAELARKPMPRDKG